MNYEQAVAREEENRLLAHLAYGRPLLGRPMAQLTWRQVLELTLAQNAFMLGVSPSRAHVFQFLWRLHPFFRRPDGTFPNMPVGAARPSRLRVWFARLDCHRVSRQVDIATTEVAIRLWLNEHWQDTPQERSDDESPPSSLAPRLNWFDAVMHRHLERGSAALDLGVALSFQLIRADYISHGKGHFCVPPSAALKRFED